MTHKRQDASVFKVCYQVLEPIIAAEKLGCIPAEVPYSFRPNHHSWDYLRLFRERLDRLPAVIEFRNAHWLRGEVFDWLRHLDLGFCCVDEPQLPNFLPPLAEVTSKVDYIRLHGGNSPRRWQHEPAYDRYDYSYNPQELSEWPPGIGKLDSVAEKAFVFANNHWRRQAIVTIGQLRLMLD